MKNKYAIFGQVIELNTNDSFEGDLLHKELSIYPSSSSELTSIEINYVSNLSENQVLSSNPSIHALSTESLDFTMGPVTIRYYFKESKIIRIDFAIKESNWLFTTLNKLLNIQFLNHKETIGQWFHEYVMVPLGFILNDTSIIHSSGVKTAQGKGILFGGTGGVGKTSLEIELCKNQNCAFLTDDISIINSHAEIYPNLSHPKIYGYNIKGDSAIKKEIFKNRGFLDKLFFRLHSRRGDQYVRRRISADRFYKNHETTAVKINSYLILVKMDVDRIYVEPLSNEKALDLSQKVIFNEYQSFVNHIVWHEFNSLLFDKKPMLSTNSMREKNHEIFKSALEQIPNVFLVKIPLKIPHHEFKENMIKEMKTKDIID